MNQLIDFDFIYLTFSDMVFSTLQEISQDITNILKYLP